MDNQDVFKIKAEYDEFLAEKKELIETLQLFIMSCEASATQFPEGSLPNIEIKLKRLDAQVRLKTEKKNYSYHLYSFNNIYLPEYEKQITDCEKNFDVVYKKAKSIVDRNDLKAKNFDIMKQILTDYVNPDNEMKIKLLLYKALKSIL
jgi:hypothetical protein